MTDSLVQALVEMKEAEALQKAKQLLDEGVAPWKSLRVAPEPWKSWANALRKAFTFCPTS